MNTKYEDNLLRVLDILDGRSPLHRPFAPSRWRDPVDVDAIAQSVKSVPQTRDYTTHVYFVRSGDFVKIGVTIDVRQRLAGIQTSSPVSLEKLGVITFSNDSAAYQAEREIHERFSRHRVQGEWFRCCDDIAAYIAEHAIEAKAS